LPFISAINIILDVGVMILLLIFIFVVVVVPVILLLTTVSVPVDPLIGNVNPINDLVNPALSGSELPGIGSLVRTKDSSPTSVGFVVNKPVVLFNTNESIKGYINDCEVFA
jgi:hypothetical protein